MTDLPSWTDYTATVGSENVKYLERAAAGLGLRIMDLGDGSAALDAEAVRTLARQPEDANGCVTLAGELTDGSRHMIWIEGESYPLEPSFSTGASAERAREAGEAMAWLEQGMTYGKR